MALAMKQVWLRNLLFLLMLLSRCQIGFAAETAAPVQKAKADLPNFHQVHPYLYRGGEPSKAGLAKLKTMGVQTVIDLRAKSEMQMNEQEAARALGMSYINLPMSNLAPTQNQVATFLNEVGKASTNQAGPVYVHCAHGSDRTGCLVGIWRVSHDNFSYDQAYKEMRKYYFGAKYVKLADAVKQRAKL